MIFRAQLVLSVKAFCVIKALRLDFTGMINIDMLMILGCCSSLLLSSLKTERFFSFLEKEKGFSFFFSKKMKRLFSFFFFWRKKEKEKAFLLFFPFLFLLFFNSENEKGFLLSSKRNWLLSHCCEANKQYSVCGKWQCVFKLIIKWHNFLNPLNAEGIQACAYPAKVSFKIIGEKCMYPCCCFDYGNCINF